MSKTVYPKWIFPNDISKYYLYYAEENFGLDYSQDQIDDFEETLQEFLFQEYSVSKIDSISVAHYITGFMSSWRFYHNHIHILSSLAFALAKKIKLENREILTLFCHDIFVRVGDTRNEDKSERIIDAMLRGLSEKLDEDLFIVRCGVKETACHLLPNKEISPVLYKVLDLDICSFAWDSKNFDAVSLALEKEMKPVIGKTYFAKRKEFLEKLLAKGPIFRSKSMKKFEKIAQKNIHRAIKQLEEKM